MRVGVRCGALALRNTLLLLLLFEQPGLPLLFLKLHLVLLLLFCQLLTWPVMTSMRSISSAMSAS